MNHPFDDDLDLLNDDGIFGNLKEIADPKIESIFDPISTPFGSDDIKQLQAVILAREQVISEMYKQLSQANDIGLVENLKSRVHMLENTLEIEKHKRTKDTEALYGKISSLDEQLSQFKQKIDEMESGLKANKVISSKSSENVIVEVGRTRKLPGVYDEPEEG